MGWKDNIAKGKVIPGIGSKRKWDLVGGNSSYALNEEPSDEETPVLDSPVKELREGLGNKMALIDFSAAEEGGIVKTPAEALLHIVAERNILDITQKEMAEHLGMGVVNYSNIERGNTPLSLPNFFKICDKLNLKITIQ